MWQQSTDKIHWNKLVSSQPHARFLQSWEWGEFQRVLGRKVLRFSWDNKIFIQAIKMNLPGGFDYWYIPHGRFIDSSFSGLQKILGEHGALFLRVDPVDDLFQSEAEPGVREVSSVQPQYTQLLDLKLGLDSLLSAMHAKTRYNINLAEKKGVKIAPGSVANFISLNRATTRRDKFASHPDWYYQKMTDTLSDGDCRVKVWQAEYAGQVIASAMVMYFGDTATYLHGASADEFRNVMAPYLLHWEVIQDARQEGFNFYDWWGVNPAETTHLAYKKSWAGITRFKSGFGGELVCNPPTFDLIYKPGWYRLYKLLSRARRFL